MVHHVDRNFAVLNAHMHVQAENQIGSGHQLHVFHNILVALVRMNFLHAPVGKRMGRSRRQSQPVFPGQPDHVATQLLDFSLAVLDVDAHRGPDFDDRLVHLSFHALLQQ